MKMKFSVRIRKMFSCNATLPYNPNPSAGLDIREEYANAFRTESYNEFWTRVIAVSNIESATCKSAGSTTAARLSSYRLFVEHLLDPDQATVNRILALVQNRPENHSLMSEYFSRTADASLLFGILLKDIDHARVKYRSLKTTLDAFETAQYLPVSHLPGIQTHLSEFCNSSNPFVSSASSVHRFQAVQLRCSELHKHLESSRDNARAKLRVISRIKHGSAIFIVALTASMTVIVATHALAVLVVAPCIIMASLELASSKRLIWLSAQLDVAAKGTYILNKDLDTISRLVARLNDELEHMRTTVRFLLKQVKNRLQTSAHVARQLKKNDSSFLEQLDELEEHLYLCFMTINRARNLVIQEMLDPGQHNRAPCMSSM